MRLHELYGVRQVDRRALREKGNRNSNLTQ